MPDASSRSDSEKKSPDKKENQDGEEQARDENKPDHDREKAQSEKSGDADEKEKDSGKKKPRRPSKRTIIIGAIVLVVLLLLGLLYYLHARNYESTDDAYTTGHIHEISARINGTIMQVLVDDNEFVRRGQPLVVLDPSIYNLGLEKARAQLTEAEAGVTQGEAQVLQRRAAAQRADANLEKAQSDFDRATSLYQQDAKAVSKADVDTATAALHSAQAESAAAKADIAASEAQLGVAHSNVANAQAGLHDAQLQLSYTRVLAPVDGVVGKKSAESGQRIQPGQALMAVVERDVWVLANLKETQLAKVKIGQTVRIEIDAVPDHDFAGHVDSFQPGTGATFSLLPPDNATGNFTKIVQRVPVKIVFDHDNLRGYENRVVPGLSCQPRIDLRSR
ncbi:MAG TPA: HlyD family secretion protein [Chthoniobacterales bacterium]|jgi:membrane fusion protein (multidrug efflux system)